MTRQPIINRSPVQLERSGVSGIPVLSGDFNRGYTKAIMDVAEVFSYIQSDLRQNPMVCMPHRKHLLLGFYL